MQRRRDAAHEVAAVTRDDEQRGNAAQCVDVLVTRLLTGSHKKSLSPSIAVLRDGTIDTRAETRASRTDEK
jgi:hypothetical protein